MYKVVSEKDIEELNKKATEYIKQGYRPLGGINTSYKLIRERRWQGKFKAETEGYVQDFQYDVETRYTQAFTKENMKVDVLSWCNHTLICGGGD